jgi:hypothetical protein
MKNTVYREKLYVRTRMKQMFRMIADNFFLIKTIRDYPLNPSNLCSPLKCYLNTIL